jgi:hypothetical protein
MKTATSQPDPAICLQTQSDTEVPLPPHHLLHLRRQSFVNLCRAVDIETYIKKQSNIFQWRKLDLGCGATNIASCSFAKPSVTFLWFVSTSFAWQIRGSCSVCNWIAGISISHMLASVFVVVGGFWDAGRVFDRGMRASPPLI